MLHFTVYSKPVATNRAYSIHRHGMHMITEAKQYKTDVGWGAKEALNGGYMMEDDVNLTIKFFFGDKRKRDIDGGIKLTLDAMNEIVYKDDSQITRMTVEKDYDKSNPRVEITINNY